MRLDESVRVILFRSPRGELNEVLWFMNTSFATAEVFFATHHPESVGLWLWEKQAFRRLTSNELEQFVQYGGIT